MILPKIILLDLDETIHFSEEMKTKAWSDILRPFGFCWEEENIGDLISVPKDKRPKSGLSPHDFIVSLIDNLNLNNIIPKLYGDNLAPEEIKYRMGLVELLFDENKLQKMIEIMKDYWSVSLIGEARRFAEEGKIQEVPGAVETIMSAHEKGFNIGIITQAPTEYAEIILKSLGLLNNKVEENYIDVVVSGDMVKNPKPHPESLILATDLIFQKNAIEIEEKRIGQKLLPEQEVGIRGSIHQEYFGHIETVFPSPFAVIGDSFADIKAGEDYPRTGNIRKILINSRSLSPYEINKINPDFTINHFRKLLPRLEENLRRRIEKR